ncbi:MAG: hypothetical protein PVH43_12525 [Desulfobacterales bacterium]|jgi:hypothetical protein
MDPTTNSKDLSRLLAVGSAEDVLREVIEILKRISSDFNTGPIRKVFDAVERLYGGNFAGYQACNTGYHDLRHAIEAFLAMSRLIHGAVLDNESFSERQIITALVAAILHDVGYIQEESDTRGTGAKHKADHEQRSMDFLSRHGFQFGLSDEEIAAGRAIILCTDMDTDITTIVFPSPQIELLGKLLGTADLMAQLAEQTYLEKLLYLYHECKEAGVGDYESEVDILRKAVNFYGVFEARLRTTLGGVDRFMQLHFASKWGINQDLYHEAINQQMDFLLKILNMPDADPRDYLKHAGIVKKVRETYHKNAPKRR